MKKPDGTWTTVTKTREVDLDAIERETRDTLEAKVKSGDLKPQELDAKLRAKMTQVEKHKVALAETGACNRVIRSLLALKNSYTKAELSKPFVIPHITLNTEFVLADPDLKRELLIQSFNSTTAVFGSQRQLEAPVQHPAGRVEAAIVLEEEDEQQPAQPPPSGSPAVAAAAPVQSGEVKLTESEFRDGNGSMTQPQRIEYLGKLMKESGLGWLDKDEAFEKYDPSRQMDALWYYYEQAWEKRQSARKSNLPWGKKS